MATSSADTILLPRFYQTNLVSEAIERNTIVRLDTGQGKTLIAVFAIRHFLSLPVPEESPARVAVFLAPTVALVEQQANVIRANTALRVKHFVGLMGVDLWKSEQWFEELQEVDVIACTPAIFNNLLTHGYFSLSQVNILVFDEVHNATGNSPYCQIMGKYRQRKAERGSGPRILGLTASPVINPKWPRKSLDALESTMDSRVVEVDVLGEGLASRPVERCVPFDTHRINAVLPSTFDTAFNSRLLDDKALKRIELAKSQLGSLAANMLGLRLLGELAEDSKTSPMDKNDLCMEIRHLGTLLDPIADSSNVSPKVLALIDVLSRYSQHENFYAMIFVERHHHVQILVEVLKRCPSLQGWMNAEGLVGHGSEGSGMLIREQSAVVAKMRSGKGNVLLATSVAEEGLDFPSCNLVVKFDSLQNLKSYIQSRGRARAKSSEYVVLVERDTDDEIQYRKHVEAEPEIRELYANRPSANVDEEPELYGLPTYHIPSTNACLDHHGAISLLSGFCSLLATDDFSGSQQPDYLIESAADLGWCATVQLPMILALSPRRRFKGHIFTTKKAAKQNVAFQVCKELHRCGALNDYLIPFRSIYERDHHDGNGNLVDKKPLESSALTSDENNFGDPRALGAQIWLNAIEVRDASQPPSFIGLLTDRCLPVGSFGKLYGVTTASSELELQVATSRILHMDESVKKQRVQQLADLNRVSLQLTIDRRIHLESPMSLLWAPLTTIPDIFDVDWTLVEQPFRTVKPSALTPTSIVVVPHRHPRDRVFKFIEVRPDVTTESSAVDVERPTTNASRNRRLRRFSRYCEWLRAEYEYTDACDKEEEPVLALESLRCTPRNHLHPPKMPLPTTRKVCPFPPGMCLDSLLDVSWFRLMTITPCIARRLHDHISVLRCIKTLNLPPINVDLLRLALTPSSAGTGESYESMEHLGDCVLLIATTIHIFSSHPLWDEAKCDAVRQNSIDNRFLRARCVEFELFRHLLPSTFKPEDSWTPPVPFEMNNRLLTEGENSIGPKVLSDVIEAVLGAAYLTGGLPMALETGTKLGLCFGGTTPWPERFASQDTGESGLKAPHSLQVIERRIGYTYKSPSLLLQAVTHRSHLGAVTHCYERLEWLGDAVLEFWATNRLWEKFPHRPPGTLASLRDLLVSNPTLSYFAITALQLHNSILQASIPLGTILRQAVDQVESFDLSTIVGDLTWLWDPPKVLGDVFEAVLGSMFIDSGHDFGPPSSLLDRLYAGVLPLLVDKHALDPNTRMLAAFQQHGCTQVAINLQSSDVFTAQVEHGTQVLAKSTAHSRSLAKQLAANQILETLKSGTRVGDLCDCVVERTVTETRTELNLEDEE